jgi:hypothetical protein
MASHLPHGAGTPLARSGSHNETTGWVRAQDDVEETGKIGALPYQRLTEEGYQVDIAAPSVKKLQFVVHDFTDGFDGGRGIRRRGRRRRGRSDGLGSGLARPPGVDARVHSDPPVQGARLTSRASVAAAWITSAGTAIHMG